MSETEKDPLGRCRELLVQYGELLTTVAQETLDMGFAPEDFVVFCMDTAEQPWVDVIDELRKTHRVEVSGEGDPIAIGALEVNQAVSAFHEVVPQVAEMLAKKEKNGRVRVLFVRGTSVALCMEETHDVDIVDDVPPTMLH